MVCMVEKLGTAEMFWEDPGTGTRGILQSRIRHLSGCRHGNRSQVRAHVPSKR